MTNEDNQILVSRKWISKEEAQEMLPDFVVPVFLDYHPLKRTSAIRLAHEAKILENAQRLKNLEEMDKSVTPPPCTVTTLKE